jgi:outer membrane protein insertion porin family
VIRREMRQLEAAWYDGARIERSKVRIRRLGFFEDVNIETPPVAGANDQADVEVTVTEKSTGNLLAGVGYSSSEKFVFQASISQQNIFGSGNALTAGINTSSINRTIALTFTEPYYTVDGVSRTLEAYQRTLDPTSLSVAPYQSKTWGGAVSYGIPISETDTINLGLRYENTALTLFSNSPAYYYLYIAEFGSTTNSIIVSLGWARDTRDDILYPTRGILQVAGVELGLPIVDLAYYKANYLVQWFWPIYGEYVLMLRGDVGYAAGYAGKPLPFYKVFYGGGVGSVRGYETATLGPRDIVGNPLGGERKIIGNAELFYPILKGDKSVRASVFMDAGQISGVPGLGSVGNSLEKEDEKFRFSYGVGLAWNSPIGPLKFSYALPLKVRPGDRVQKFQFQVGSVF